MSIKKGRKIRAVVDEDLIGSDLSPISKKIKLVTSTVFMGRSGAQDKEIYEKCSSEDYHIITANSSDFKSIQNSNPHFKTGVIGIVGTSRNKSIENLSKVISKDMPFHEQFYKKSVEVSSKGTVIKTQGNSTNK